MPHFECKAGGVMAVISRGRVPAGVQAAYDACQQ